MHSFDGFGPDRGTSIAEIITIDGCDDDMIQIDSAEQFGDSAGLIGVDLGGPACLDVAEPAGSCARIPQDHDRGGSSAPALTDIGA